jgi:hypothetical protein
MSEIAMLRQLGDCLSIELEPVTATPVCTGPGLLYNPAHLGSDYHPRINTCSLHELT